ncbi:MAG: AAA family ATPase [Thermoguttaceae bacterium]|nr:AAA family ATPase [Thermoguttaceae bacterium]
MAIPKISKESVFKALNIIDHDGVPTQHQSVKYDLITENGQDYPPKYVVALADHIENGTEINTSGYDAGEAVRYLRKLGFTVKKQKRPNELNSVETGKNSETTESEKKMFDRNLLNDVICAYKQELATVRWHDEKYKWEAVKWFQDNWDIEAADFAEMLDRSLKKTSNLLGNAHSYPRAAIVEFAQKDPETVRNMFSSLYDEENDVFERIKVFRDQSKNLLKKYGKEEDKHHYQDASAITVYLWLRYPDKYYIYKKSVTTNVADKLKSDCQVKGNATDRLRSFLRFYDEINLVLKSDTELIQIFQSQLTDTCYPDPQLKTLTQDLCYYINQNKTRVRYWLYAPGENATMWNDFYKKGIMGIGWHELGNLNQYTSQTEITKFLKKYHKTKATPTNSSLVVWEFVHDLKPGDVVIAKKGKQEFVGWGVVESDYEYDEKNGDDEFPNIRRVSWEKRGNWQLEGSLPLKTLTEITDPAFLSKVKSLLCITDPPKKTGYQNPFSQQLIDSKNIIFHGAPGTGKTYLAKQIAADVISDGRTMKFDELSAEQKKQVEFVQFHPSYNYTDFVEGLRPKLNDDGSMGFELHDGIFKVFANRAKKNFEDSQKSDEVLRQEASAQKAIDDFLSEIEPGVSTYETVSRTKFTITEFDDEHIDITIPDNPKANKLRLNVSDLRAMLESGKEFGKVKDVTEFFNVSPNQNHSYYFVIWEKIKSQTRGVHKAQVEKVTKKNYIFIIDEINRGEISKIFGELFFTVDPGYRGKAGEVSTQYSNMHPNEKFYIPENVYIIGTMNDIDRSVDTFDFAMRRRFRLIELKAADRVKMLDLLGKKKEEALNRMTALNKAIAETDELNENYQIGPAYFLKLNEIGFDQLWTDYLKPLLREYITGMHDEGKIMEKFAEAYGSTDTTEITPDED